MKLRILDEPSWRCRGLFYLVGLGYLIDGLCLLLTLGQWSFHLTFRSTKWLAMARIKDEKVVL